MWTPTFSVFFSFIFLAYFVYFHSISECLLMKQTPLLTKLLRHYCLLITVRLCIGFLSILILNSCGTIGYFLGLPHIAHTRLKLPDFAEP
jgi:hypothetical protein